MWKTFLQNKVELQNKINELTKALADKDIVISDKDKELAAKAEEITSIKNTVSENEKNVVLKEEVESLVKIKDEEIAKLKSNIEELNKKMENFTKQVSERAREFTANAGIDVLPIKMQDDVLNSKSSNSQFKVKNLLNRK